MKVIWEIEDIKGGRQYSREGITEVWTIGYMTSSEKGTLYVSMSSEDGMVTTPMTNDELAKSLTGGGYKPVELLQLKESSNG